jgi:miniconductance mechanosensitive channel
MTNLGLFRNYFEQYLRTHPDISKDQSILVRHRAPEGNGLPLQVFAFASKTTFIPYENIQSEVFEHLLAMLKEFDLKVYQPPTGDDIQKLKGILE